MLYIKVLKEAVEQVLLTKPNLQQSQSVANHKSTLQTADSLHSTLPKAWVYFENMQQQDMTGQ